MRKEADVRNAAVLDAEEIEACVRLLVRRYHAGYALLFGSYARGEADEESDIDVVVYGGTAFHKPDIFAFAEDLRAMTGKDVDAFEISEVDAGTPFYRSMIREGRRIA